MEPTQLDLVKAALIGMRAITTEPLTEEDFTEMRAYFEEGGKAISDEEFYHHLKGYLNDLLDDGGLG